MLSQAEMDVLGQEVAGMYGGLMEPITYYAKASANAVPVAYTVQARCRNYRLSALTTDVLLPTDLECRIQTALVTWTPSEYDEVRRADGSRWKVVTPGIRDGLGHPFFKIPLRQVG
jgi:hypothetical protein